MLGFVQGKHALAGAAGCLVLCAQLACGDTFVTETDGSGGAPATTTSAQGAAGAGAAGAGTPQGGGGQGGGVGGAGGAPPTDSCGKMTVFSESFEQGNPPEWSGGNVSNGKYWVDAPASQVSGYWATPWALADFTNTRVTLEVPDVAPAAGGAMSGVELWDPVGGGSIRMFHEGGLLRAEVNADTLLFAEQSYDAVAHRYWMIKESGGQLYFETSPDGDNYTVLGQIETPAFVSLTELSFFVFNQDGDANPGSASFDNINIGHDTPWCPAATFTDDFSDLDLAPKWHYRYEDTDCVIFANGGEAYLEIAGTEEETRCLMASSRAYDMTQSSVTFALGEALPFSVRPGTQVFIGVIDANDNEVAFGVVKTDNVFSYTSTPSGQAVGGLSQYTTAHSTWRIRHDGGAYVFEVDDGSGFEGVRRVNDPAAHDASAVKVFVTFYAPAGLELTREVVIDSLN